MLLNFYRYTVVFVSGFLFSKGVLAPAVAHVFTYKTPPPVGPGGEACTGHPSRCKSLSCFYFSSEDGAAQQEHKGLSVYIKVRASAEG